MKRLAEFFMCLFTSATSAHALSYEFSTGPLYNSTGAGTYCYENDRDFCLYFDSVTTRDYSWSLSIDEAALAVPLENASLSVYRSDSARSDEHSGFDYFRYSANRRRYRSDIPIMTLIASGGWYNAGVNLRFDDTGALASLSADIDSDPQYLLMNWTAESGTTRATYYPRFSRMRNGSIERLVYRDVSQMAEVPQVPLPASGALFAAGLFGLTWAGRRRRDSQASRAISARSRSS